MANPTPPPVPPHTCMLTTTTVDGSLPPPCQACHAGFRYVPPVPVDEGDERKDLSHSVARTALLACSRVLRRDFPNCHAVLASYIDEQESVRSERDAELRRLEERERALLQQHIAILRERDAKEILLAMLRTAARRVPIVRSADVEPFYTCLGCGKAESDECVLGCWVRALENAIDARESDFITPDGARKA